MSIATYPAVTLPPMRAGETDGRYIDCTLDLGAPGDTFTSAASITITITRVDGTATTASDLALAGASYPTTLDTTRLIPTIWLTAPAASAGVAYVVTLSAATTQGREFIRDAYLTVQALMG